MFDSTKDNLNRLLEQVNGQQLQLPDFQRDWVWDEEGIHALLVSIIRGFPVGAILTLEVGGEVNFKARPLANVKSNGKEPVEFLLDGQQRLTSLYQSLFRREPVKTRTAKGTVVEKLFFVDLEAASQDDSDPADWIIMTKGDGRETSNFGRNIDRDYSSNEKQFESHAFPLNQVFDPFDWMFAYKNFWKERGEDTHTKEQALNLKVVRPVQGYQMPIIRLSKGNSREAICTVFEKVNTGGKKLDAFELLTAVFAASEFNLREDWLGLDGEPGRLDRLRGLDKTRDIYAKLASTDFLQACTALSTMDRRNKAAKEGRTGKDLPPVTVRRDAMLNLPIDEYQRLADSVEEGFAQAKKFFTTQRIIWVKDVPYLPSEAAEALVQAATGVRPTPAAPIGPEADPWSHPDAIRRFRVLDNLEELQAALDSPWEKWSVFLHPAQREFVERDFNGPARVIGSAGTGKTVVALHRAARLAQSENANVLLATFNANLARRLQEKVPLIANQTVAGRITVAALGDLIADQYVAQFGPVDVVPDAVMKDLLDRVATSHGNMIDRDFLFDEWKLIVDAWDVQTVEEYRNLPRLGRKVRMASSKKDDLWKVFEGSRHGLDELRKSTPAMLAHRIRRDGTWPYTHVLVDEAQDISVPELLLLGQKLGADQNGLFFAGDIGQRIFRAPFPWSAANVEVRGRSRSLKVNYRTSHQIRLGSETLLPETLVESDGSEESRLGVTSVFEGPHPEILKFSDRDAEISGLRAWILRLVNVGVPEDEIAILARTPELVSDFAMSFSDTQPALNWLTMHDAKGSEFQAVAVIGLDDRVLPDENRILAAKDEAQLDEVMSTERHLLYVGATRARDYLWISGSDPISEFLMDLLSMNAKITK